MINSQLETYRKVHFAVMAIEICVRLVLLWIRYKGGKWKTIMKKMESKKQPA